MTKGGTPNQRTDWHVVVRGPFASLAVLYLALFAAYGTESPFFPSFLASRGLSPAQIGALLSAGTVVRLVSSPCLGMVADRFGPKLILALAAFGASMIILFYLRGTSFQTLLSVCLLHSVVSAPLNPLVDTLALRAIAQGGVFPYGWLRGIGSAGFIAGTLASGAIVSYFGLQSIIVSASLLLLTMLGPIARLPSSSGARRVGPERSGIVLLLVMPQFRAVLLVSSLVIGSHAMSDAFAVIHWSAAGVGAPTVGLLWSEAVASEILVFIVIGPWLLRRVGPSICAAIAAAAGVLRWAALANSTDLSVLVATQCLHGFTFSLMHLACMQILSSIVPGGLAATAQTLYGTCCLGLVSTLLTILSGLSYGAFGGRAFWLMAAICLLAIPFTLNLAARDQP